jgi:hypothetical protein
MRYLEV